MGTVSSMKTYWITCSIGEKSCRLDLLSSLCTILLYQRW